MRNRENGKAHWAVLILTAGLLVLSGCGGAQDKNQNLSNEQGQLPWDASGVGTVTEHYGLATIRPGTFYAESKTRPWSSYWFPHSDTSLYDPIGDNPAPLQKYDEWTQKAKKLKTHADQWEKESVDNGPESDSWAGLCNAWAKASVMHVEPVLLKPVEVDGIKFTTFDLKALLIKSYENTEGFTSFGQRYNGERGDDYDDIYPDQFHRFLQAELFQKGKPFIMDRDPGIQVWNIPVFKAQVTITKDDNNPNVMHVDTTVAAASSVNDLNYVGTYQVTYEYYYDLYGIPQSDGSFLVKSGVWTGPSVDNHPDFVTAIPDKVMPHHSENPELKTDLIDEIIAKAMKPHSLLDYFGL